MHLSAAPEQKPADYERIAKAIEFISLHAQRQPSLEEIADHLHLSPFHFQRLFSQWAGLTPKQFLKVLTLEHAKQLLLQSSSVFNTSGEVGLTSSSRLHDHFVSIEAVTPGEFKRRGEGLEISYGLSSSDFGTVFAATTARGICRLSFPDENDLDSEIKELKAQWPLAKLTREDDNISNLCANLFQSQNRKGSKIALHISGTNFQISVWKSLLRIPEGSLVSYGDIASRLGKPNAVRAVGTAVGANPVGYLIPCHRVIRQSGALGGYRWGLTRKQALIAREQARADRY